MADGIFAEGQAELLLSAVQCNGSESHLLSCEQERLTHTGCGPLEDAGVVCQGKFMMLPVLLLSASMW